MHISINDKTTLSEFVQRLAPHTNMSASRLKTAIAKSYAFKHITAFESALSSKNDIHSPAPTETSHLSDNEKETLIEISYWLDEYSDLESQAVFGKNQYTAIQAAILNNRLLSRPYDTTASLMTKTERHVLRAFSDWCHDNIGNDDIIDFSMKDGFVEPLTFSRIHATINEILARTEKEHLSFWAPTLHRYNHSFDEYMERREKEMFAFTPLVQGKNQRRSQFLRKCEDELYDTQFRREGEQSHLYGVIDHLTSERNWDSALVALKNAGFGDVAKELRLIQIAMDRDSFLSGVIRRLLSPDSFS